jgi:tetratricopeptide (TPR) repeat protein/triacylglycerol esterase/lipase EstA (alpha/beta hydrolase family)
MPAPITFVVSGIRRQAAARGGKQIAAPAIGTIKQSVQLTAGRAAQDGNVRMEAVPGEDAVVFHLAQGPELWLHPENAVEMLRAQHDPALPRGATDAESPGGELHIPSRLRWRLEDAVPARGSTRGFLGDVFLEAVEVITGIAVDKAAGFVGSKVVESFDSRVDGALYRLNAERLSSLKGQERATVARSDSPSLVLVHGTFSDTSGTFGKLWTEHPQSVRSLFSAYDGRVYGLDHPTLGASPIANAITLARAVAPGARLHLLTHSRGGLVAETLARVAAGREDAFAPFQAEGHGGQRAELQELARIVAEKRLRVERIVRVACPAHGTLLASKRLDAYVSVVKWALELAGVPVAPQLVDFLGEVARQRANPESFPGLAAQMPDSPLVQWLHGTDETIAGDLRVVAGDLQGDSVISWVKTLLSDAFFWTDNDLVVQTRSMYGGTPRARGASFVLDRGGKVSHFNYFSNPDTARAIVDALVEPTPAGFRAIGPLSWGGTSSEGTRAAIVKRTAAAAAELPALFLLPGILGSNLRVGDDRVWLGWRLVNGFAQLAYDADNKNSVVADGPLGMFYDELASFLSNDHDVIPFAFDWRRPIEEAARRLADAVDAAIEARESSGKPVRLLAHSMGGLVARALQLERPRTWANMMRVKDARLLMLGTPNDGSFAPMQMLSGDDTFGNLLTVVGAPFRGHETRQLIAQFPGLLQLQAGLLEDLGKEKRWQELADNDLAAVRDSSVWHRLGLQLDQSRWGIPGQEVLDSAVSLRRKLDEQRDADPSVFEGKLLMVVGKAALTPAGYQETSGGLVYLDAPEQGDGRVTLQSALLPGVEAWTIDCEHGSLPMQKDAFEAYRELLHHGKTTRLAPAAARAGARGDTATGPALVRSRPARSLFAGVPPQKESEILVHSGRSAPTTVGAAPEAALRVTIVNGDLTYIADPLLIGHYRSSRLTGAERVMDSAIDHAMSASLERGLYPVAAGTHQIFVNTRQSSDNPWQLPRPAAVIVAGLGAEGELRGSDLVETVRQAVIAWAQRLTERSSTLAQFSLATTLLGSGGCGVSAGQAAQLIAQGVREANVRLSSEQIEQRGTGTVQRWPRVGHLQIIELFLDRAGEAWRSLRAMAETSPSLYVVTPAIETGIGRLRRPPDAGYRGADYDFVSALSQRSEDQDEQIVYNIDTKRARSEIRAQSTQIPLIRNLVSKASNSANDDPRIGHTLFSLLVPADLEAFMGSSAATVLELDRGTAAIPWELLDSPVPGSVDDRPWAIRTKLLRKLRTDGAPGEVHDASADDSVLVIGDPSCDRKVYPRLFGARREAAAVAESLSNAVATESGERSSPKVIPIISPQDSAGEEPDSRTVMNAVMARPWRIIHIAGHGEPPLETGSRLDPRGVVLSDQTFLGPREIGALRVIPELVFVNCCHLATGDFGALLKVTNYDRAKFASGVAESLIKAGVRCVIAAGWAVDDGAAEAFARTFYGQLLNNASFIEAVAAAREVARAEGGNTWAAYQCYGDPDWRYRRGTGDGQQPAVPSLAQEFAAIASAESLLLALETMAVRSEFQRARGDEQASRLQYLEDCTEPFWRGNGAVAEAFGNAWAKAGRYGEAISWYERARTAADGRASLAAIEQLANLRVRCAWDKVSKAPRNHAAREDARKEIDAAMELLATLRVVGPTIERESLYGSAYKRVALIEAAAGNPKQEAEAIAQMKAHYAEAERLARERLEEDPDAPVNLFYPAMNRMAAEIALVGGTSRAAAPEPSAFDAVRQSMASAPADFWTVVGQTELNMYESLLAGRLGKDLKSLFADFQHHHERVSAPKMWGSVHDNATFVLSKYQKRAPASEAKAAGLLLAALAKLAGQTQAAQASTGGGGRTTTRTGGARKTR